MPALYEVKVLYLNDKGNINILPVNYNHDDSGGNRIYDATFQEPAFILALFQLYPSDTDGLMIYRRQILENVGGIFELEQYFHSNNLSCFEIIREKDFRTEGEKYLFSF